MAVYRRPDVYIEEPPSFPISIQEIESAIPVFIGYTEKDPGEPMEIFKMDEYIANFGSSAPYDPGFTNLEFDKNSATLSLEGVKETVRLPFFLYHAIQHYFHNGGGKCFVISVGIYPSAFTANTFVTSVGSALDRAIEIEEVTLIVVPELVKLDYPSMQGIIAAKAKDIVVNRNKFEKFFILDMIDSDAANATSLIDKDQFDDSDFMTLATEQLGAFMAFYYPYLITTYQPDQIKGLNDLAIKIKTDQGEDEKKLSDLSASSNVKEKGMYIAIVEQLKSKMPYIILPPSGAIAGVYVNVDNQRGVWKAPANVGISNIRKVNKVITDQLHEDLNINTLNQRSVCAIRNIPGYGIRVMGARTLYGASNDWRYINVRRTASVFEKSIKNALKQFLFEPNNADTWAFAKAAIDNFLYQKWEEGALYGAKQEQAFFVRIGLGVTMNVQDVLNGRMIVEVGLAIVRPAEFIILRITQFISEA